MTITFAVSILLALLVFVAVVWVAFWIVGQMKLPDPIGKVAVIIIGILALVVLLSQLFPGMLPIR